MNSYNEKFSPNWVSPPGDTILDLMEERDWSQAELASRLGYSPKHLNQLVKGKASLSHEAALKLERVLGGKASFWTTREAKFREQLARLEAKEKYAQWTSWLDRLPLRDLKMAGIIPDQRLTKAVKPQLVEQLLGFFGVATPDEWITHYESMNVSFRRTKESQSDVGAIASWLRLGEKSAEAITTPKYNRAKFERAIKRIREMTVLEPQDFYPKMRALCLEAGVKLVLEKSIPRAHVSGVARWLNGHSPLIQLSLYGKSNDRFWFTFFHEAAHILLHSEEKRAIFLDDTDFSQSSKEEEEANAWARDILIPPSYKFDLCSLRSSAEIAEFSNMLNIHPGIVVGRLQHDGNIQHETRLNVLKQRFEILPGGTFED